MSQHRHLPADDHVHSEWSWDADDGSMRSSCERAVQLGLPSIAFTEHVDLTSWAVPEEGARALGISDRLGDDGCLHAAPLDVDGYLASIERCRAEFPDLRILTGVEIGEPHWWPEETAALLAGGRFDRVLGSVHSLPIDGDVRLVDEWYITAAVAAERDLAAQRSYLAESLRLVESTADFEVFAHIDYLTRQIVRAGRSHDPRELEDEYRAVLRALSSAGRVLEINTSIGLDPVILRWWHQEGGPAVSFGSDAHTGGDVGRGFVEAVASAEGAGFRRPDDALRFWPRA